MTSVEMVFEKIMGDSQLVEDFLGLESVDDMYEFCMELDPTLAKDEFDYYISDVLDVYAQESGEQLDSSVISKVAGGVSCEQQYSVLPLTSGAPAVATQSDTLYDKGWIKTADKIKKYSFVPAFGSVSLPVAVLRGSALK